jgi:hypothetical protein
MHGEKSQSALGLAALVTVGILSAGPHLAQAAQNQNATDADSGKTVPMKPAPGANLSQKLSNSNGVLHPKDVDPKMQKPTPPTGPSASVIKPPGTPGGAPGPTPK